jgi:hypothetical protein
MKQLLVFLLVASGCATSLSSFQPAHVLPRGHISVEAGLDLSIPTGSINDTIETAKRLAQDESLSEEEKRLVFAAGFNLALNPPWLVDHLGVTYSPADNWEVGLRHASGSFRLGGRRQLLSQQDGQGWDVTVGLGFQHTGFDLPLQEAIPIVRLDGYSRWNIDIPLVAGRRGDFHRIWGGPRLVFSHYGAGMVLAAPGGAGSVASEDAASIDGQGAYLGLQAGAAFGYRWVFLAFELTVARFFGNARLQAFGAGSDIDTTTWIVYPGVAVLGQL